MKKNILFWLLISGTYVVGAEQDKPEQASLNSLYLAIDESDFESAKEVLSQGPEAFAILPEDKARLLASAQNMIKIRQKNYSSFFRSTADILRTCVGASATYLSFGILLYILGESAGLVLIGERPFQISGCALWSLGFLGDVRLATYGIKELISGIKMKSAYSKLSKAREIERLISSFASIKEIESLK